MTGLTRVVLRRTIAAGNTLDLIFGIIGTHTPNLTYPDPKGDNVLVNQSFDGIFILNDGNRDLFYSLDADPNDLFPPTEVSTETTMLLPTGSAIEENIPYRRVRIRAQNIVGNDSIVYVIMRKHGITGKN